MYPPPTTHTAVAQVVEEPRRLHLEAEAGRRGEHDRTHPGEPARRDAGRADNSRSSSLTQRPPRAGNRRVWWGSPHASHTCDAALLAILAPMGEIDPSGTRRESLEAFLDQKVEEGYAIETRSDTHAIIFRRPKGLKRFTSGPDPGRYVVQVDEDGIATMRPAEPRRA